MVVLTAPLMFGSLAMVLGDRVSKRSLIVWTKFAELMLMALGTYARGAAARLAALRRARRHGVAERAVRAR